MLAVMVLMLMSHRASSVNAQMRGGIQGGALRGGGASAGRVLVLRNGGGSPVAREAFVKPLTASIKADVDAIDELAKKEAKAGSEALLIVLSDDPKTTVRVFSVREGVPTQALAPELKIDSPRLRVAVNGKLTDENYWWRHRYEGINRTYLRVVLEDLSLRGLSTRVLGPNEISGSPVLADLADHAVAAIKGEHAMGQTRVLIDLFKSRIVA